MTVDNTALKVHPGLNPDYFAQMAERKSAQEFNRHQKDAALRGLPHMRFREVPKQPNKYVPHIGTKQRLNAS